MAMTDGEALGDTFSPRRLLSSETVYDGRIWDVVQDTFEFAPDTAPLVRDYIDHPGAVAVLVLNDADEVLMINQYRHPVRMNLWEIPAGLMDIDGEAPHLAAARELAEEADLVAADWAVLVDLFLSPGSSSEAIRIYLARNASPVPEHERHERTDEEADMALAWVPLDEAVAGVLAGRIHNPSAVAGLLAAAAARTGGYASLRPVDVPFEAHPRLRSAEPRL
ncbi:ADP-ribose pyrophosphatase [Arthrobacter sp. UCD-GKA]|jgi:ADP-ribose pyrophosphatase|uniref:NUDIX domain-containing protein n=1 Tax=Arthrobacter sp. UCD-GKA TaxID=1913576 RepID=UPI0008DE35FB|nr:NUDIX hydrolase [Arthrobacter sp. UCD-GKA]OIH81991.1 ADP-ribose pyrophosphatase [Arthrobacter sp. UCD-GKA]